MNDVPAIVKLNPEPVRILVVEDDDGSARLLQIVLTHWPSVAYTLRRVADLAAAIREVNQGETDLVLLDLGLPDSQGIDTFVRMHAAAARVPIVVFSGTNDEELAATTIKLGAQEYIVKGREDGASLARTIRYSIERCRVQQALVAEHDLLRSVMDNLPEQVYLKDIDSRFVSMNPVTARFFGAASPEELVGKCDFDFFPRELAAQFLAEEQALLHHNQQCVNREAAIKDSAGNTRWMLTTKVPLRDQHGDITGLLGLNRDITEQKEAHDLLKHAHEELLATQLQLIEAAKMESVAQLAAGIAHEVKNPLAIALMGLEYLASTIGVTDGQAATVLNETQEAILQADAIVRELLSYAVPSKPDLKLIDLNTIVVHVSNLIRHEARKRVIATRMDLGRDLPHLRLDKTKIEQTLVNLCMNAIEAMPTGGTLRVTTRVNQLDSGVTEVITDVEDTGPGIAEEDLAKLFDPFFTKRKVGKGTGLGLTVARRIIELHGGTIRIGNRSEGGARATIVFRT
ncbi:MAG: ATP-binding protein [Kiritimatiellia bacterium]